MGNILSQSGIRGHDNDIRWTRGGSDNLRTCYSRYLGMRRKKKNERLPAQAKPEQNCLLVQGVLKQLLDGGHVRSLKSGVGVERHARGVANIERPGSESDPKPASMEYAPAYEAHT